MENEEETNVDRLDDRLKNEGLLTRNKGANSLKSVKNTLDLQTERFGSLFGSIMDQMKAQSKILSSIEGTNSAIKDSSIEAREDAERAARLEDIARADDDSPTISPAKNDMDSLEKDASDSFSQSLSGILFGGNILPNIAKTLMLAAATPFVLGAVNGLVKGLVGFDVADWVKTNYIDNDNLNYSEKMNGLGAIALSAVFKGPVGALKAGLGFALTELAEEYTGIDIPAPIQAGISALFGMGIGGKVTSKAFGLLFKNKMMRGAGGALGKLMFRAMINPVTLSIAAVSAAIAGIGYLMKKLGDRQKELDMENFDAAVEEAKQGNFENLNVEQANLATRYDDVGGLILNEDQREAAEERKRQGATMIAEKTGNVKDILTADLLAAGDDEDAIEEAFKKAFGTWVKQGKDPYDAISLVPIRGPKSVIGSLAHLEFVKGVEAEEAREAKVRSVIPLQPELTPSETSNMIIGGAQAGETGQIIRNEISPAIPLNMRRSVDTVESQAEKPKAIVNSFNNTVVSPNNNTVSNVMGGSGSGGGTTATMHSFSSDSRKGSTGSRMN